MTDIPTHTSYLSTSLREHLSAIVICTMYQVSVIAKTVHEFQTAFINPGFAIAKTNVTSSNCFSRVISAVTNIVTWMHLMGRNKDGYSKHSADGSFYMYRESGLILIIHLVFLQWLLCAYHCTVLRGILLDIVSSLSLYPK